MAPAKKTTKKDSFEMSLQNLEKIVTDLEAGDLSLEESIKVFEQGTKLAQACESELKGAQQKIEILVGDQSEPFPWDEESDQADDD